MKRFRFALMIVVTAWIMGSAFPIGKLGLQFSSPLLLLAIRFTLLTFMNPLWMIIISALLLRATYQRWQWIGVFIGLIGVCFTQGWHFQLGMGIWFRLLSGISPRLPLFYCKNGLIFIHG